MPDTRQHRGAHPQDESDFAAIHHPTLATATAELSWLFTRGYSDVAALKLVGDHHQLTARQRMAVLRASCSDRALSERASRRLEPGALAGRTLGIDGFNCLITLESMLSRAPVFIGRDGAHRDLGSVHGTYRRVEETRPALMALRQTLEALKVAEAHFYLDRPVGNSGRLRALIGELFSDSRCPVSVELFDSVDPVIVARETVVASSDSWVLERAPHWVDLPRATAEQHKLRPFIVRLDTPSVFTAPGA